MSESDGIKVLQAVKENFAFPQNDTDEDEDEVIVVRRKKKKGVISDVGTLGSSTMENNSEPEESVEPAVHKSSSQRRRRIQLDDSSDEDDEAPGSGEENSMTLNTSAKQNTSETADTGEALLNKLNAVDSDDDDAKSPATPDEKNAESSDKESDASSDSDDDSPPLRIFRKKTSGVPEGRNAITQDDDTYDNEMNDEEETVGPDPSEIAQPQNERRRGAPRRASMFALQSETQRIVRESSLNLPYHRPSPKKLQDFMSRPVLGSDKPEKKVEVKRDTSDDDLPDLGRPDSNLPEIVTSAGTNAEHQTTTDCEEAVAPDAEPERKLTARERLLKFLGPKCPKLLPTSRQRGVNDPTYIDFDAEDEMDRKASEVGTFRQRFMKHVTTAKSKESRQGKSEINAVQKDKDCAEPVTNSDAKVDRVGKTGPAVDVKAASSVERWQLLKQQFKEKMKKRRAAERQKREELYKLENEIVDDEEEEEEEEELSEGESDEEEQQPDAKEPEDGSEKRNGIIESEDENDDETQPVDDSKANEPYVMDEVSLAKTVSDGSVLLYEDSTRSSASTSFNKSGRVTPALDRTCSDDSFYSSLIPLRQPERSNASNYSHFAKPEVPKGEFDDSCFENDSQCLSQPFRLDFEPSQSQFLDSDGFIKEDSIVKPRKDERPMLPPGAEDDNAVSDCNMSQLLDLCTPFDNAKTQDNAGPSGLMDKTQFTSTQELLGLCTGKFPDTQSQAAGSSAKQSALPKLMNDIDNGDTSMGELLTLCTGPESEKDNSELGVRESTRDAHTGRERKASDRGPCDISNIDDASQDLYRNEPIDESFGFDVLSGTATKKDNVTETKDSRNSDSDSDDEPITIVRTKRRANERMAKEFLEDEAELSGEEGGSEDEEEVGPDGYESDEIVEELPAAEVMNRQLERVHRKQVLEEDQKAIELLQEAFMGGEEIAPRERKFRWRNIDETIDPTVSKSDEEEGSDGEELADDSNWRKMKCERDEYLKSIDVNELYAEDSRLLTLGRQAYMSHQNSLASRGTENSNQSSSVDNPDLFSYTSMDGFTSKNKRGSFLNRPKAVLAKLANFKELTNINGPRNTHKMVFKAVSPKVEGKTKRKSLPVSSKSKEPAKKRKKIVVDEDSNSIFNFL